MGTESPAMRWLALIWSALILAVATHQIQFWQNARLDTDVLALLPENEQEPEISLATRKLTGQAERSVIILVGAQERASAQRAALVISSILEREADLLLPAAPGAGIEKTMDFYKPWRDRLLTPLQRDWLAHATPEEIRAQALLRLYQPVGGAIGDILSDPLGLWQAWWAARSAESKARPQDGMLWLEAEGKHWVLLAYELRGSAFSVTGDTPLSDALSRARAAASQTEPLSRILAAGVPLHAEAAAAQSSREMNIIACGSLAAVLLLVWLTFRSLLPIVMVGLSLVIGCAVALSVTVLVFGKVHMLTLVFGASLVGVAEDYGFHYFAARQVKPVEQRQAVLRHLLPGLALALATSVIAYLALGLAPFPGLRQMAVFSAAGLVAAFLTVLCWFPALDRNMLHMTGFANWCAASLTHWPRWQPDKAGMLWAFVVVIFVMLGLLRLDSRDDLRQLQSSPGALVAEQIEAGRLLNLSSPAQFFLIEGASAEQALQREELLKARLDKLGVSYRAVSDWLPSGAQQRADATLTARAETIALSAIAAQTGESIARPAFAAEQLKAQPWLSSKAAAAIKGQWLGEIQGRHYSVLLLNGLTPSSLPSLTDAGRDLPGIRWVDRTEEYSALLARYRIGMAELLMLGYAAVFAALLWRFRRNAWRALLPTALGTLLVLAIFGWTGVPLQLFSVLALVLLLGMGVDYGIFLLEHPGDGTAWLAVALAGVSTLLSFGLLALSSTPALHVFGLTMLLGEVLIWVLTPYFRINPKTTVSRN